MSPRPPKLPRALKRSDRKRQVIKQLSIWHDNGYATEATSYRLAKALDMRPAATFTAILDEMVAEGDLLVEVREQPGRYPTKFYLLAEKHVITEKYFRRSIAVRKRGQVVQQLEMFS